MFIKGHDVCNVSFPQAGGAQRGRTWPPLDSGGVGPRWEESCALSPCWSVGWASAKGTTLKEDSVSDDTQGLAKGNSEVLL